MSRKMKWTRYVCTYGEPPPSARCGHCAAKVSSSVWDGTLVVFHAGTNDRQFLNDLVVLHLESGLWSRPATKGGPSPRAFHCCTVMGTDIYYFGGRTGPRMHNEVWKLDTNLWEWTLVHVRGESKPDAREKADCIGLDAKRMLIFGGFDGIRWLNDVFILNVETAECQQLKPTGSLPPPRSGHKLSMLHQGLLLFGGETTNTQYLGDLWALKGLYEDAGSGTSAGFLSNEAGPKWVRMQLSGPSPSGRSGHGFVGCGAKMVVYGGRGDEGWLSKKTVYHRDVAMIDRESVRWVKTPGLGDNEPSERSFHTLTLVGKDRLLLFGGYNGKSTYGDMWYLEVNDEGPAAGEDAGKAAARATSGNSEKPAAGWAPTELLGSMLKSASWSQQPAADASAAEWMQANPQSEQDSMLGCLRQRLGLPRKPPQDLGHASGARPNNPIPDVKVKLLEIAVRVDPNLPKDISRINLESALARARSFFSTVAAEELTTDDVQALLHDYRAILPKGLASLRQQGRDLGHFGKWNHVSHADLGVADIPELVATYRDLLSAMMMIV